MKTIHEILQDFAEVNAFRQVSNYYELVLLSSNKQDDIYKLTKDFIKEDNVELIQLKDWKEKFLFCEYPDGIEYWLRNVPKGYELNGLTPKQYIMELLLTEFEQELYEVYWVRVDAEGYYACSSEEYIFKTKKGIYFLSLQVHD